MNNNIVIGTDIGGSHITAALVDVTNGRVLMDSLCKAPVNAQGNSDEIISHWAGALKEALALPAAQSVKAIGIAMPGPFDYPNGISLIKGVAKYESIYGMNIREILKRELNFPGNIYFENDAACFGLGESWIGGGAPYKKVIAITLGTGFGTTFLIDNKIQTSGKGVPTDGYLYNAPFKGRMAEDYISTRWLIGAYKEQTGQEVAGVKELDDLAKAGNETALQLFKTFGENIGLCLSSWIKEFGAEVLVIGGNIRKGNQYFQPALQDVFKKEGININIAIAESGERSAIAGAAYICNGGGK